MKHAVKQRHRIAGKILNLREPLPMVPMTKEEFEDFIIDHDILDKSWEIYSLSMALRIMVDGMMPLLFQY